MVEDAECRLPRELYVRMFNTNTSLVAVVKRRSRETALPRQRAEVYVIRRFSLLPTLSNTPISQRSARRRWWPAAA